MKTVTLVSFRDDSTGELGLAVKGMPRDYTTNAALDGLTIAHDLLEHVNGPSEIGSIDDELEALGAIWYVRGQHGELRRDNVGSAYSIEENIASGVTRMFTDHVSGDQYVNPNPPRTVSCEADDAINDILACADSRYADEIEDKDRSRWPAYRAATLARMRIGYRKARRKWERRGRYAANNQFWAIANAVGPCCEDIESEGMQFKLTYGNGEATCEPIYPEDY
jgi:hypothetical protein